MTQSAKETGTGMPMRAMTTLAGALAALALWGLGELWGQSGVRPLAVLVGVTFVLVQGGMTLTLSGPLPARKAFFGALFLALPVAGLVGFAGLRFAPATDVVEDPAVPLMTALLVLYGAPFLLVRLVKPDQWRRYEALFDAAWTMHLRFVVALVFAGLFWLLLLLSNELLKLVEVAVIEALIRREWLAFGLTGGLVGLGAAVVYELRGTISPYLLLRLLRLMVPLALLVVVVFLAAVPLRPFSALFGEFSAAATLMGTAIAAITLVSAALDQSDADAVAARWMQMAVRALAILVLPLTALAAWAIWQRVGQYGWTPDRVLAQTAALLLLAYGAGYAICAANPGAWMARIRQANVAMAGLVIVVATLWMTPVLDAQRIAVASQIARFQGGAVSLDGLPLWEMAHDWGKAGRRGLARLEEGAGPDLAIRIEKARASNSRFRFTRDVREEELPAKAAELARMIPVSPTDKTLGTDAFSKMPAYRINDWTEGCKRLMPDGRAGCVLVVGDFQPSGAQGVLIYRNGARARAQFLLFDQGVVSGVSTMVDLRTNGIKVLPATVITQAQDGAFELRPTGQKALWIQGHAIVRGN